MIRGFYWSLLILLLVPLVLAAPRELTLCQGDSCTLSAPRAKMTMNPSNDQEVSLVYSHNLENYLKTEDGGATWPYKFGIGTPSLDYHASLTFDDNYNHYFTHLTGAGQPTIFVKKLNAPGRSTGDLDTEQLVDFGNSGISHVGNVIAVGTNDVWLISRTSYNSAGNIEYRHSSNGGATWNPKQWIENTGYSNVRIGSFRINNNPAVVVWLDNDGIRYYEWDGNSFVQNIDSDVVFQNNYFPAIQQRDFVANFVDNTLHFAYSHEDRLIHRYKTYNNGQAVYNEDIVHDYNTGVFEDFPFEPFLVGHGNDLYILYQIQHSANDQDVVWRKWNSTTESWGPINTLLADGNVNRYPIGPMQVNPSAEYIPVAWTNVQGTRSSVWFDTISTTAQPGTGTPISTCQTLDQAGTTYELQNNVNDPDRCFDITAPNVVLDCKGHTITWAESTRDMGIRVSNAGTNVEIKNCVLRHGSALGTAGNEDDSGAAIQTYGANTNIHDNDILITASGRVRGIRTLANTGSAEIYNNKVVMLAEDTRGLWLEYSAHVYNNILVVEGCSGIHAINNEYSQIHAGNVFSIHDNEINGTKVGCPVGGSRSYTVSTPFNTHFYNNTVWGVDADDYENGGVMSTINMGSENLFEDNVVFTDGRNSRGIYTGQSSPYNIIIRNNIIRSVSSNPIGLGPPLRLRDGLNISIYNNEFNSSYFTKIAVVKGDDIAGSNVNGEFFNNTLQGLQGIYFYEPSTPGTHFNIHDNTIVGAQRAIWWYGENLPHNFTNDRIFDCGINCQQGYEDIRIQNNMNDQVVFLNVTFPGDPIINIIGTDPDVDIRYYLHINVFNSSGSLLPGASIFIEDAFQTLVVNTQGAPAQNTFAVTQFIEKLAGRTYYTNHNVTVTFQNETQNVEVTMDQSRTLNFTFNGGGCVLQFNNPPCETLTITELGSAISNWYGDVIGISELLQHIKAWKTGSAS